MIKDVVIILLACMNVGCILWQLGRRQKNHAVALAQGTGSTELSLLKAVVLMEKKERHRMANELHYKSSSTLAAVRMYLAALYPNGHQAEKNGEIEQVHVLLESASAEINKSFYSLLPEMALENGLDKAVCKFCSHVSAHSRLSIEYDAWGKSQRYHEAFELAVFRFIQLLLNFVVQQAKATGAMVQLGMQDNRLTITREDNGCGYDPVALLREDTCLICLDDCVCKLGGQLELRSDNGLGVFIQLSTIPYGTAETQFRLAATKPVI
jgi:signal transduction histidine kinase